VGDGGEDAFGRWGVAGGGDSFVEDLVGVGSCDDRGVRGGRGRYILVSSLELMTSPLDTTYQGAW